MNLTEAQKLALAKRVMDNFNTFLGEELEYQVEAMKDNDELAWEYYITDDNKEEIYALIIDMIAVPVS